MWRLSGVEPPSSANWISLFCAYGIVVVTLRLQWRDGSCATPRVRLALVALLSVAILTNRTFLAWTSSGLETALFNLLVISWWAMLLRPCSLKRFSGAAGLAALIALTRPDGLLFATSTLALLAVSGWRSRKWSSLLAGLPLLVVPLHLLWRYSYYGEWLPNTYYAKQLGAWPEAGMRYFACFVIEYGLWILPFQLASYSRNGSAARRPWHTCVTIFRTRRKCG